MLMCVKILGG